MTLGVFSIAFMYYSCFAENKNQNTEESKADSDTVIAVSQSVNDSQPTSESISNIPEGARILIEAYPSQGMKYENNKIMFPDGSSIIYDDGKEKDFDTKLDNSDIEDMFTLKYDTSETPEYLADAGRSRCDELFKKMYGSSESEARKHLVYIKWFGQNIQVTSVNGVDKQLQKVAQELAEKHPELKKYYKCCGTFYWRQVRGAKRQSAHSYGIAIDINTEYSNYWLWKNGNVAETKKIGYENRIPLEIVQVFEKHGFVWGGRWYHYDTMHFEYRPEIVGSHLLFNR